MLFASGDENGNDFGGGFFFLPQTMRMIILIKERGIVMADSKKEFPKHKSECACGGNCGGHGCGHRCACRQRQEEKGGEKQ